MDQDEALGWAIEAWEELTLTIDPWGDIANGQIGPLDVRTPHVSVAANAFVSLARVTRDAYDESAGWKRTIGRLAQLDWRMSNPMWVQVGVVNQGNGKVASGRPTIARLTKVLRDTCGLT